MHRRVAYSLAGIRDGWQRERSFRSHVALGLLAVVVLVALGPAILWWMIVLLALTAGLGLELMSGALEALIDLVHPDFHPQVRIAEDMASGGVLLINIATIIVVMAMIVDSY